MTNFADLRFSDEEVMSIFLFGVIKKQRDIKSIYHYAKDHLRDLFPHLPGYVGFVQRLNQVADGFIPLVESLLLAYPENESYVNNSLLMDSMPIILAHRGRRFHAKVAPEIATNNGYCATKKRYYYGVKLHIIGRCRKQQLPHPEYIGRTSAGMNDNKAFEQIAPTLTGDTLYADKAYHDRFKTDSMHFQLLTPVKKAKGHVFLDTADLSTAISRVRQPIESFFNWLHEKTHIQIASKVRSYQDLMVHGFGRIAAASVLNGKMGMLMK